MVIAQIHPQGMDATVHDVFLECGFAFEKKDKYVLRYVLQGLDMADENDSFVYVCMDPHVKIQYVVDDPCFVYMHVPPHSTMMPFFNFYLEEFDTLHEVLRNFLQSWRTYEEHMYDRCDDDFEE